MIRLAMSICSSWTLAYPPGQVVVTIDERRRAEHSLREGQVGIGALRPEAVDRSRGEEEQQEQPTHAGVLRRKEWLDVFELNTSGGRGCSASRRDQPSAEAPLRSTASIE